MPECQSGHPKAAEELGRGLSPVVSPLTSIDVLSDGQLLGLAYHGRGISVAAAAATRSLGPPQQGAVSESSKTRSRSQERTRTLTTMRRRWYDTAVCIKSPYVRLNAARDTYSLDLCPCFLPTIPPSIDIVGLIIIIRM